MADKTPELELTPTPVNVKKATAAELRKVPLNSANNESVTKKILAEDARYLITIPSTDRDKFPVFVGINGISYNIPRDIEVEVPFSVVAALREAVHKTYSVQEAKGAEGAKVVVQKVARFPVQSRAKHDK